MPPVLILRSDGELVEEPGPEDDAEVEEDDIIEVVRGQPTTAPPRAAVGRGAPLAPPLSTVPPAWVEDLVDDGAARTADLGDHARPGSRTDDLVLRPDHRRAGTADLALDTAPPAPRAREHSFGPEDFGPEDFGPDAFRPDALGPDALGPGALGPDALGSGDLHLPQPLPASAYLFAPPRLDPDALQLDPDGLELDPGPLDARVLDTAPPYMEATAPLPPPAAYLGTPASARAPMAPASWGDPEPRAASAARHAVAREPSTTRVAVSLEGTTPRGLSTPLSAPAIPAARAASSGGVPSATRAREPSTADGGRSISSVSVSVTGVGEREDGRAAPRRSVSAVGRARPIKERDRRSVEPAPLERDAHAERAAQLYQQALEQVRAGQHGPALSTMRLALSYAPADIRYADAYRKLQKHLGVSGTPDTSGGG
jgi:hypothetical protein